MKSTKKILSLLFICLILSNDLMEVSARIVHNRLHKKRLHNRAQTKASKFEMVGAIAMFFLQIVAQLEIPKISDLAKNTLKFKQFSESCYRGITDIMGFTWPPLETDRDDAIDTKEIENSIREIKEELQKEAKYYLGNTVGEDVLNDNTKLCNALKAKMTSTTFDARDDKTTFKAAHKEFSDSLKASKLGPCYFLLANGKKDFFYRKVAETYSPNCLIRPFYLGTMISPVPYMYCGVPGNFNKIEMIYQQNMLKIQTALADEVQMEKLFKASIVEETDRRAKISQCSENLKDLQFDNDSTLKFLTVFNKIIVGLKKAKDFYEGCIKPAYDYVKTKAEEAEAKRRKDAEEKALEDIRKRIQTATSLAQVAQLVPNMTPEQTAALQTELQSIAQFEADIQRMNAEIKAWDEFKTEMKNAAIEEDKKQKKAIEDAAKARQIEEAELDSILYFSEDGYTPSRQDKENIRAFNADPAIKQAAIEALKTAAKEEVESFINGELEEMKKNPIKYAGKIAKERAVFVACPTCYVAKAGGEFVLSVGVNLLGKAKTEVLKDNEYLKKHTLVAKGIDMVFDEVTGKARGKMSDFLTEVTKPRHHLVHLQKRFTKAGRFEKTSVRVQQMKMTLAADHLKNMNLQRNYQKTAAILHEERIKKRNNVIADIVENLKSLFMPTIMKYICGAIEKALINLLGGFGTVWMIITKGKAIYDIVRKATAGYRQTDLIEKWSNYGEAVGMGIKLIAGGDTGFCGRRRRFYRRVQRLNRRGNKLSEMMD